MYKGYEKTNTFKYIDTNSGPILQLTYGAVGLECCWPTVQWASSALVSDTTVLLGKSTVAIQCIGTTVQLAYSSVALQCSGPTLKVPYSAKSNVLAKSR